MPKFDNSIVTNFCPCNYSDLVKSNIMMKKFFLYFSTFLQHLKSSIKSHHSFNITVRWNFNLRATHAPHVPVDGNARDGECGDEGNADGDHAGQLTDPLDLGTEPPLVHDLHQGHGAHHCAQEEVTDCQVDNQDVVYLFQRLGFPLNDVIRFNSLIT